MSIQKPVWTRALLLDLKKRERNFPFLRLTATSQLCLWPGPPLGKTRPSVQGRVLWLRAIPKEGHSYKPLAISLSSTRGQMRWLWRGSQSEGHRNYYSPPLECSTPLTSYRKFVLSGNSPSRILVGLISWELIREELLGWSIAPALIADLKAINDVTHPSPLQPILDFSVPGLVLLPI